MCGLAAGKSPERTDYLSNAAIMTFRVADLNLNATQLSLSSKMIGPFNARGSYLTLPDAWLFAGKPSYEGQWDDHFKRI